MDFHMNGGEEDTSYANNSLPQRLHMLKTKPILEEAVQQLFCSTCAETMPKTMSIADLGCSSGPNSFLSLTMILDVVDDICFRSSIQSPAEFQVFMNDLPGNDFNTLFKAVPAFYESLRGTNNKNHHQLGSPCYISGTPGSLIYGMLFPARTLHGLSQAPQGFADETGDHSKGNIALSNNSTPGHVFEEKDSEFGPSCFISGVPGSFHGRLFPAGSLHFVHSATSLHWLSQVPTGLADLNKGNITLNKCSSPVVFEKYLQQFKTDFTVFLKSRSEEIVTGGCMVLSLMGRKMADPFSEECYDDWGDLADVLRDMVAEGFVEETKLDSFNMPYYEPHVDELRKVIQVEGSFDIFRLEEHRRANGFDGTEGRNETYHNVMANCLRAVAESMLAYHFGSKIIAKLFERLKERLLQIKGMRKKVFLIVSLIKKG